ncbi:MAG: ParA family protein [Prevotellaceae bacterium]|jgi:cellulose biosynthesis protein BcsQ|nr:ParA family protein [Prevotellaceae bacterium]
MKKKSVKKPVYISFGTQKGGAGKSSFTILTASLLHYKLGYNVAVIDCDYPQYSLADMRTRDLAQVPKSEWLKGVVYNQYTTNNKKMYPIVGAPVTEAMEAAERLEAELSSAYDFIFFDLPGTVNQDGALSLIAQMNYLFCPLKGKSLDTSSTAQFMLTIQESLIKKGIGNIKAIHAFWNSVDAREKTPIYGKFSGFCAKNGISLLETKIPYLVRFGREVSDKDEVFISTILPTSTGLLRGSNVACLVEEILGKIGGE